MSLLSPSFLAAHAPAPIPLALHPRQSLTIPESDLVDFACTPKHPKPATSMLNQLQCPPIESLIQACTTGGRTLEEWNKTDLDPYPEKSLCAQMCTGWLDGSLKVAAMQCAEENCLDAAKNRENNYKYFEQMYVVMYKDVCEGRFGFKGVEGGVESGGKSGGEGETVGESRGEEKVEGSENISEDGVPKKVEGITAYVERIPINGAAGLAVGGGWGASAVVMLAVGSALFGLWV